MKTEKSKSTTAASNPVLLKYQTHAMDSFTKALYQK